MSQHTPECEGNGMFLLCTCAQAQHTPTGVQPAAEQHTSVPCAAAFISPDHGGVIVPCAGMVEAETVLALVKASSALLKAIERFAIVGGAYIDPAVVYEMTGADILAARAAIRKAKGEA